MLEYTKELILNKLDLLNKGTQIKTKIIKLINIQKSIDLWFLSTTTKCINMKLMINPQTTTI